MAAGRTRKTGLLGQGATFKKGQRRVESVWVCGRTAGMLEDRNDNPKLTHLDHGKLTHPWVWLWVSSAVLPDRALDRLTTEEAVGDRSCQPRTRS